ncbi:MAG: nitroreductase family deazaflavin-dependent oxidoreductase [Gammaproteobacteria bacterium]
MKQFEAQDPSAPLADGHRRNPLTSTPTGGRILSAAQVPWFMLLPPRGFGVLTTTGRKSGKKRRRCVRVVRVENTAYATAIRGSKAGWLRNARAHPTVWLRIRGGTFEGAARALRADEVDVARNTYCETLHRLDRIEYVLHMPGRPTPERIKALHEHWFTTGTPLAIELVATTP